MVERPLSMREARGSIPRFSIFDFFFFLLRQYSSKGISIELAEQKYKKIKKIVVPAASWRKKKEQRVGTSQCTQQKNETAYSSVGRAEDCSVIAIFRSLVRIRVGGAYPLFAF